MRLPTCCTLALFALAAAASVQAAEYPERNITVIVPLPAGGASDMTARLVTPKLGERVKQSVIVDNRAGANGSLGATAMKQAPADGYTLLVGSIGPRAVQGPAVRPAEGFRSAQRRRAHAKRFGGESRLSREQRW